MRFTFSLKNMKHSFALLLTMLVSCWIYGEEDFDPFTPPKTDGDAPPQAAIDPFAEAGDAVEDSQNGSVHRWDDQVDGMRMIRGIFHVSIAPKKEAEQAVLGNAEPTIRRNTGFSPACHHYKFR